MRTFGDRQFGQVVGAGDMAWAHDSKTDAKDRSRKLPHQCQLGVTDERRTPRRRGSGALHAVRKVASGGSLSQWIRNRLRGKDAVYPVRHGALLRGDDRRPGQGSEGREVTARTRTVRRVPIEVSVERYRRVLAKKSSQAVAASLRLLSEHLTNRRNSQKHSTFTVNLRSGPVLEFLRCVSRLLADQPRLS